MTDTRSISTKCPCGALLTIDEIQRAETLCLQCYLSHQLRRLPQPEGT
jgi:hypothetical protein